MAYNIRLRAGGSHASRRSTLSGHAALSVTRLTPRPKPEAPAGPRGVRAAPPPLPPGARSGAGLPCLRATGAGRLANQSTSAARRVPLRLRLASGFGPRRASPRKGGRRGVGRVVAPRQSRSRRLVLEQARYRSMGRPRTPRGPTTSVWSLLAPHRLARPAGRLATLRCAAHYWLRPQERRLERYGAFAQAITRSGRQVNRMPCVQLQAFGITLLMRSRARSGHFGGNCMWFEGRYRALGHAIPHMQRRYLVAPA